MPIRLELTPTLLIQLHVRERQSLASIAKRFGVSRQRVHQLKVDYEKKYGKIKKEDRIDPLTLKKYLDSSLSINEIAEKCGVSTQKVRRWIEHYEQLHNEGLSAVPIAKKRKRDRISRAELVHYYTELRWTDVKIAEHFRVSPSTICNLRKQFGITRQKK